MRATASPMAAPTPGSPAAQTLALRKTYSISLYAVDCLRIGMAGLDATTKQAYLAACMESLADIQEGIQSVFPNDKTLGD
ncbi:MAG: hypothetical protein PHH58_03160 [Rhodoferax sp.]|nr:hypothetical protein [Rhodoferax sp.]